MFLKEKVDSDGNVVRIKARLVAGGNHQYLNLYPNRSAPTAGTDSVMILSVLAASQSLCAGNADFPGAFLNAEVPDGLPDVHVHLDRFITGVLVGPDEKYQPYV
ncbi:hypothetical protein FVE85_7735 [Porphyridium purpureum]|uniref:Reverse transcriptase Ty1/copia-type domain-containing protein n=1 Tax=Porphyridium purpureum TaxID=35688 RepID=A0A5J4YKR7_PORPP|nr:hypothetical protein FVE85_7735 [Porphyridium purpureum]|eukprot:POR6880..scf210_14